MRVFVAVDIPENARKKIFELQKGLSFTKEQAKCTPSKEQHITIKFLGEIRENDLERVKERLEIVRFGKFIASINTSASFANENYLRVAWFIAEPRKDFSELYNKIDRQLRFIKTKEQDEFIPHITLARFKYVEDRELIIKTVKSFKISAEWEVNAFKLYKSVLTPKGPIYELVKEYYANN